MSRQTPIAMTLFFLAGAATASAQSPPVDFYASQDIEVENGGISNDYTYTHTSDDQYEGITEAVVRSPEDHHRYTSLQHKWTIPVDDTSCSPCDTWAFHVEAHQTPSSDGDHFVFAWSSDDATYHNMLTVTKTADDDDYQVYTFTEALSGIIYIRVVDTFSWGNPKHTDTIYVDHMFIQNYDDVIAPVISGVADDVSDHAWVHLSPDVVGGPLLARQRVGMAYDSTANRTIMFGGNPEVGDPELGYMLDDTWVYDYGANTWTKREPSGAPHARAGHALAYAPSVDRTILFGGTYHVEPSTWPYPNDTWEYNYDSDTWTERSTTGGAPQGRWLARMVWDASAQRMLLFGGSDDSGSFDDTWEYDPATATWNELEPSVVGGTLGPRTAYGMAYNSAAAKSILFGGYAAGGYSNDTWAYDYATNTWTKMSPTVVGGLLTPRTTASTVYDSAADQIIMFGGYDGHCQLNETWVYDFGQNEWSRLDPDHVGGELRPREAHAMVYDLSAGKPILFGGWTNMGGPPQTYLNDTWEYMRDGRAAEISWETDEESDSVVHYGPTTALGVTVSEPDFVTDHLVSLRNLDPDITYYYQVQSTDRAGNTATDPEAPPYHEFSTVVLPNQAPDAPSDPSPADGATDVGLDVDLSVYVSDPDGDEMYVSFYDESGGLIGTVYDVPSGTYATTAWEGLTPGTAYGWYATAHDAEASTESDTWHFTTTTVTPGAMYVWDISWSTKQAGPHTFLSHAVTVRYDSDQDGVAEASDALVDNATVYSTLTGPGDSWNFSGVTENGVVEFSQKVSATGQYEANVTNITHAAYGYTPDMDVDNPDFFTL